VDGTDDAFRDFVADVEPALLGTAFLLTGRRADAEDAVVAALASVHRHRRRLDPDAAAAEARRVLVTDVLRRHPSAPEAGDPDLPAADRAWLQALAGLPARTRAAVVLRLYAGLHDDDTAELLGESPATVAERVEAALDELALLAQVDVVESPVAALPATEEESDDDPYAAFRPPEERVPPADPYAAFRRPETPTPQRRLPRPAVPLGPAPEPAWDDDPYAAYRRPGTSAPVRPRDSMPEPAAALEDAADDDPDAIFRRPP
jgi:DNA-directed RNA polymerase specialized sigma24 family protein